MLGFVYLGSVDNAYLGMSRKRFADSGIDYIATAVDPVQLCDRPKYADTLNAVADSGDDVVDSDRNGFAVCHSSDNAPSHHPKSASKSPPFMPKLWRPVQISLGGFNAFVTQLMLELIQ
jgi:hypothetical protein